MKLIINYLMEVMLHIKVFCTQLNTKKLDVVNNLLKQLVKDSRQLYAEYNASGKFEIINSNK